MKHQKSIIIVLFSLVSLSMGAQVQGLYETQWTQSKNQIAQDFRSVNDMSQWQVSTYAPHTSAMCGQNAMSLTDFTTPSLSPVTTYGATPRRAFFDDDDDDDPDPGFWVDPGELIPEAPIGDVPWVVLLLMAAAYAGLRYRHNKQRKDTEA